MSVPTPGGSFPSQPVPEVPTLVCDTHKSWSIEVCAIFAAWVCVLHTRPEVCIRGVFHIQGGTPIVPLVREIHKERFGCLHTGVQAPGGSQVSFFSGISPSVGAAVQSIPDSAMHLRFTIGPTKCANPNVL